jgi:hypothetical protein
MKKLFKLCSVLITAGFLLASCEGPMGPAGKDGQNGTNGANGQDANETCKDCHNPDVVDAVAVQFELSKHSYGEAAFEEAGNPACTPCHASEGFKYVCAENKPSTFTLNTTTGKYVNDYQTIASKAYGEIGCFTCHNKLHTGDYLGTDMSSLTTKAAVSMTMWAGAGDKSINLTQDGGMSNLCVKCHQPRPLTNASTKNVALHDANVIDYNSLSSNPDALFYDPSLTAAENKFLPGYRSHVHYGTVGAIFAGKGGVEFTGSLSYSSSDHTTLASCQDCHMATITGRSGGHTFAAKGNFNGCNVTDCHSASPLNADASKFKDTQTEIKTLLNTLGSKIKSGGIEVLHRDSDPESNLWSGLTTNKYDGYLDIYDPTLNSTAALRNPNPTTTGSSAWTSDQLATNAALPTVTLKNVLMGAIINFQLCLREFSLGIHNKSYTKALLTNSIDALTAAGY